MPANPKYLSSGPDRAAKITAGLIGGYLLSAMFHYVLGLLVENKAAVVATSVYTLYMLWMVFFIIPFIILIKIIHKGLIDFKRIKVQFTIILFAYFDSLIKANACSKSYFQN